MVGFLLMVFIFVKCLIPLISRIRNRNLVEESGDPKDGSEIIPPSSERNRVTDRRVADDLIVSESEKEKQSQG